MIIKRTFFELMRSRVISVKDFKEKEGKEKKTCETLKSNLMTLKRLFFQ